MLHKAGPALPALYSVVCGTVTIFRFRLLTSSGSVSRAAMLPKNLSFLIFCDTIFYGAGSGSGSGTVTGTVTRTVTGTGTVTVTTIVINYDCDSAQANKSYDSGSATIRVHVRKYSCTAFIPPNY